MTTTAMAPAPPGPGAIRSTVTTLAEALELTKRVCGGLGSRSWPGPPRSRYAARSFMGRFVLQRMVDAGAVPGPIHLADRLRFRGARRTMMCEMFDALRAEGLVEAPVDNGTESWTVTPSGAVFLRTSSPGLLDILLSATK